MAERHDVVDLLYNLLYNKSTTNRSNGVWPKVDGCRLEGGDKISSHKVRALYTNLMTTYHRVLANRYNVRTRTETSRASENRTGNLCIIRRKSLLRNYVTRCTENDITRRSIQISANQRA